MNSKALGILAVVTGIVVLLAIWATRSPSIPTSPEATGTPTSTGPKPADAPGSTGSLFPTLAARANDVSQIVVKSNTSEVVLSRADKPGSTGWLVHSKSDYPADANKVRDAVVSLTELVITDHKTQRAENYAYLGVTDPESKDSPARSVTLKDTGGQSLAAAVIGNTVPSAGAQRGETKTSVYIRRASEVQAFQAEGRVDARASFDPDPLSWLDRDVISIDSPRIKSVTLTHADGTRLKIEKENKEAKDFTVRDLPAGRELKYAGAASPIAGALSRINLDDVMPIEKAADGATPTGSAEYVTFDGLVVTIDTSTRGGTGWAAFAARYEELDAEPVPSNQPPPDAGASADKQSKADEARKEADALNRKLNPWAFALPDFKLKQFQSTMDELLKPTDAPKSDAQPTPPGFPPGTRIQPEK